MYDLNCHKHWEMYIHACIYLLYVHKYTPRVIITASLHRQTSHDFKDSVHTNIHTASEGLRMEGQVY